MKNLLLLIGLYVLAAYTLEAKVLSHNIEEGAIIEIPTSFVTESEEVEEYEVDKIASEDLDNDTFTDSAPAERESIKNSQINEVPQLDTEVSIQNEFPKNNETQIEESKTEVIIADDKEALVSEETPKNSNMDVMPIAISSIRLNKNNLYPQKSKSLFLSLSFGYSMTTLDELDESFKNDVWKTEVSLLKTLSIRDSFGVSLSFYHPSDELLVVENTSMTMIRPYYERIHFLKDNLFLVGSLGLVVADFNIRKRVFENTNLITYKKVKSGLAVGIAPEVGIKFLIKKDMFFDLTADYTYLFGRDNEKLGGLSVKPKLIFSF